MGLSEDILNGKSLGMSAPSMSIATNETGAVDASSSVSSSSLDAVSVRFHDVHGKNIELNENGRVAARNEKSFCDAIVFTHRPVRVYEKVYFRIVRLSTLWNGMIRFGFTSVDPETLRDKPASDSLVNENEYDPESPFNLPKYIYPTLTNKKGTQQQKKQF